MSDDILMMKAAPGQHITTFAESMVGLASIQGKPVQGDFNDYTLFAHPFSSVDQVLAPWIESQRVRSRNYGQGLDK